MSAELLIEAIARRREWNLNPDTRSFDVLTRMVLTARDIDGAEHYYGGYEPLAMMSGFETADVPHARAVVQYALAELIDAGLIEPLEVDGDVYAYRITLGHTS